MAMRQPECGEALWQLRVRNPLSSGFRGLKSGSRLQARREDADLLRWPPHTLFHPIRKTIHHTESTLMKLLRLLRKPVLGMLPACLFGAAPGFAQQCDHQPPQNMCPELKESATTPGHPCPQPRPQQSGVTISQEGGVTVAKITTGTGCFAASKPFIDPPGTNLLPTIYTNAYDGNGKEMPNTLPSTPAIPYNLFDGD